MPRKKLIQREMKIRIIVEELFYFIGAALVASLVLELIQSRIVQAYVNICWPILAWLICGLVLLFLPREEKD
jgi:hypothetical protein